MSRWIAGLFLGLVCAMSGCSMCCGPDDYAYPTYGGKWQRTDRFHGRVGSNLSDAGDTMNPTTPPPESSVDAYESLDYSMADEQASAPGIFQ